MAKKVKSKVVDVDGMTLLPRTSITWPPLSAVNGRANDRQEGGRHYQGEYTQQHWDYCWERQFDFFQYVITKYVERHKKKNGLEDLRKARHYLDKYIEIMEKGQPQDGQAKA